MLQPCGRKHCGSAGSGRSDPTPKFRICKSAGTVMGFCRSGIRHRSDKGTTGSQAGILSYSDKGAIGAQAGILSYSDKGVIGAQAGVRSYRDKGVIGAQAGIL
jgi:preprotein translocase subunit Sec61beta